MDSLSSYFDQNSVRLDELDGTLRRDVPEDYREPNGAWVLLRRYVPKSLSRQFDAELRELERTLVYVDGVAKLSEEVIDQQNAIGYRRAEAHLMDWNYYPDGKLPLSAYSFDLLPDQHTNAILATVISFSRPRSDEDALKFRAEHRGMEDRRNGKSAGEPSALSEGTELVASAGAALPN